MEKQFIGKIAHYFDRAGVAVIELEDDLSQGDTILIEDHTTGETFDQPVDSMQMDKNPVEKAGAGDAIGLKVVQEVHAKDKVFKIID